ncbi:MAG: GNAT family N-acetyltransferase, partial [Myxococcales bacterium]
EKTEKILARLDYKNINEIPPFDDQNPSAENIARWAFKQLKEEINAKGVRMKRVAVASHLQGQGIGTRMLDICEAHARSMGASTLSAHARETAVRFYLNAGFATDGEYFDEAGIPHIMVRKRL